MQWRLQVQESITTLQQGEVHLERSVTSLQVESSNSTYMMSLHLVNQGWTEAQIEEKQQAEKKKQVEILSSKNVPFVNGPFESEIHDTVNFTQFCCVLLVTWCYRVLLSCYLRSK